MRSGSLILVLLAVVIVFGAAWIILDRGADEPTGSSQVDVPSRRTQSPARQAPLEPLPARASNPDEGAEERPQREDQDVAERSSPDEHQPIDHVNKIPSLDWFLQNEYYNPSSLEPTRAERETLEAALAELRGRYELLRQRKQQLTTKYGSLKRDMGDYEPMPEMPEELKPWASNSSDPDVIRRRTEWIRQNGMAPRDPDIISTGARIADGRSVRVSIRRGEFEDLDRLMEEQEDLRRQAGAAVMDFLSRR